MNLRFNGKSYTDIESYKQATYTYCHCENDCKYYYGEIDGCMYGEHETLFDKSICKCDIDNVFR